MASFTRDTPECEALLGGGVSRVVLASASPRRRELLSQLLLSFACVPVDIDESPFLNEGPAEYVQRLAVEKANACADASALIIAADTTVTVDGRILGKPEDYADARAMLQRLSARTHQVFTAVALRSGETLAMRCVETSVTFVSLDDDLIAEYLQTDEPWDKAGAYGIQGRAGTFVSGITGSYSAVVGLPLSETRELLAQFGVKPQWTDAPRG